MRPNDEDLMAYADGELSEERRLEIERVIEGDPKLIEVVEQHRAMRAAAHAAFREAESAPMSDGLSELAEQLQADISADEIKGGDNGGGNAARILWPLAAAATFVIGVMGSQLTQAPANDESILIAHEDGRLVAGKPLASVLSNLPVATQQASAAGVITIDASFISGEGKYCRQFQIDSESLTGGIACREDDAWRMITLANISRGSDGRYHTAGAEDDPLVITAVRLGVEKKLSPEEEAKLIKEGWK